MFKISDFKIAKHILLAASSVTKAPFVDLEVEFDKENGFVGLKGGKIFAGNTEHLTSSIFNIVWTYLSNFEEIAGVKVFFNDNQKELTFSAIIAFLRKLSFDSNESEGIEEPIKTNVYAFTLAWIVLKDVVCPLYDVNIDNVKVIVHSSPFIDASFLQEKENDEKLIFLNSDIAYEPYKMSNLLLEAIKAHGLIPYDVISDIVSSDMKDVLEGIAKLEFKDDSKVDDFIDMLMISSGVDRDIEKIIDRQVVTAQSSESGSSWWFMGLIEKLLEPSRGNDWDVYQNLEPLHQELWDKINLERKKAGRDGLPYESLLRIKDGEIKPEDVKVIEKALRPNRVW